MMAKWRLKRIWLIKCVVCSLVAVENHWFLWNVGEDILARKTDYLLENNEDRSYTFWIDFLNFFLFFFAKALFSHQLSITAKGGNYRASLRNMTGREAGKIKQCRTTKINLFSITSDQISKGTISTIYLRIFKLKCYILIKTSNCLLSQSLTQYTFPVIQYLPRSVYIYHPWMNP